MTITVLILSLTTAFQPVEDDSTRVELSDLSWMQGCWEGTGFGQTVRECWIQGPDGRLTGMFDMINPETGEQQFSELFVLDEFETGYEMRLKHFNADFTGWEGQNEWVTFPLLETGDNFARFEGVEYRLDAPNQMSVDLRVSTPDGSRIEHFNYRRVD